MTRWREARSKPADEEAEMIERYDDADVTCDELPGGVLVGTMELVGCGGGDWHLAMPDRASRMLTPKKHPQPVWFNPF